MKGIEYTKKKYIYIKLLVNVAFYYSSPVLHRCVPKNKEASVKDMYKMLNSWDATQQFLGDIYATWHYIAIICGISFCMFN